MSALNAKRSAGSSEAVLSGGEAVGFGEGEAVGFGEGEAVLSGGEAVGFGEGEAVLSGGEAVFGEAWVEKVVEDITKTVFNYN